MGKEGEKEKSIEEKCRGWVGQWVPSQQKSFHLELSFFFFLIRKLCNLEMGIWDEPNLVKNSDPIINGCKGGSGTNFS